MKKSPALLVVLTSFPQLSHTLPGSQGSPGGQGGPKGLSCLKGRAGIHCCALAASPRVIQPPENAIATTIWCCGRRATVSRHRTCDRATSGYDTLKDGTWNIQTMLGAGFGRTEQRATVEIAIAPQPQVQKRMTRKSNVTFHKPKGPIHPFNSLFAACCCPLPARSPALPPRLHQQAA